MGRRRQTIQVTTLAMVVAVLATACGGGREDDATGGTATVERGGVFRTAITDFGFTNGFDPTGEYGVRGWTFHSTMLRTLVSYPRVAGPPGNELQADLATELPQPTDNGLTYTFKLKPNVRFGPPLDRPITSRDVAYAFQRINTQSLAAQYGF